MFARFVTSRRMARTAALIATVAIGGCDWPSGPENFPDIPVRGRVTIPSGDPVAEALVLVTARSNNCEGNVWSTVSTGTNANGEYATFFEHPDGVFEGCLQVTVGSAVGNGGRSLPDQTITTQGIIVDIVIGGSAPPE